MVQRLQGRPAIPPQAAPAAGPSVRTVAPGANTTLQAVRTREPAPMLAIRPVFAPVAPFAPETVEVQRDIRESALAGLGDEARREAYAVFEAASPPPPPRRSGNPLMTPEQGDDCHAGGWDDAEIDAFTARQARFKRMGRAEADHLAERLTLRDRQHDDRRLCLECAALADNRRCLVAARGRMAGVDRRLEPVPTILQRCPGFETAR